MNSRLVWCATIVSVATLLGSCLPLPTPVMADGTPWSIYVYVDPALEADMAEETVERRRTLSAQLSQSLLRHFAEIGFHVHLLRTPTAYDGPNGSFLVRATVAHYESGGATAPDMGTQFVGAIAGADMATAGPAIVAVSYQLLDENLELMLTNRVSAESSRSGEAAVNATCEQIAEEVTRSLSRAL
jgi:hypothetical protein